MLRFWAASGGAADSLSDAVDVLHTLTSFETFDSLSGETRSPDEVVKIVTDLARKVLGVGDPVTEPG